MSTLSGETGCLLFDGARYPDATAWLKRHWPQQKAYSLFRHSDYEAIAEAGPMLLAAPVNGDVHKAWRQGSGFPDALWLETSSPVDALWRILQRRLRVFSPAGRELWLRLGDALPLRHAWLVGAVWPEGFWHQVSSVWAMHEQCPVRLWHNSATELDAAPKDLGLSAQLTLDWPLLCALSANPAHQE